MTKPKVSVWRLIALALASLIAANAAGAASGTLFDPPGSGVPEASVSFARDALFNWSISDDEGIWIQTRSGRWYYATFFGPCVGIRFANALQFHWGHLDTLDRWAGVGSRQSGRCQFRTFKAADYVPRNVTPSTRPAHPAPGPAAPVALGPRA